MHIKRVIIEGFKSYKDQIITEEFSPKVNCVACFSYHKEGVELVGREMGDVLDGGSVELEGVGEVAGFRAVVDGEAEFNDTVKQNAVDAGFRIFEHMVASGAVPTEATVTSIARIATSGGGGGVESAFELVRTMKERYGASPRLRIYGPALFGFCCAVEPDRAYDVEDHMAAMEELEIADLLEMSVKTGKAEKVYECMHKLRRTVGCVAA